ncbi:8741_t:CDS:2 [Funneliformis geosporum]|uniref:8741_t:CDS:1 n=1 Tax=Funneliformis geosporum TaxID=1117311 RepID=A0A9W4X0B3_9GLOM|nr:8741_t:CDS:2 [Funneliformis geosporum]
MALAAPVVASFEWTIDATRELIRPRRENHDNFEFVPNNRHERIWRTISNQLFLNKGWGESPRSTNNKPNSA